MTEAADFFVAGGTLRPDDPSYVTRPADHDLLQQLQAGEFCYVLTPRQMGKSSLMVRTAQRLREDGTRVAIVDLTSIGTGSSELSPDQWYLGLLSRIRTQLRLATDVQRWWDEHGTLGISQRFTTFLHDVLLVECSEPVVILIDEIDSTLNLNFRDDFFAAIRAVYNERATDPTYQRLTFALFGVATPTDLIQDRERTPFNIGRRIDLREFTLNDAQPLRDGLAASFSNRVDAILKWIFYWTNGHPYLTQKLCHVLQTEGLVDVNDAVQRIFLSAEGRKDPNLTFVQDRVANSPEQEKRRMLQLYRRVQRGDWIADDNRSPVQNRLELYGLVGVAQGQLQVRNRIYERVFDGTWITSMMPVDRRQRRAVLSSIAMIVLSASVILWITLQPTVECSTYQERFINSEASDVRLSALANLFDQGCRSVALDLFYAMDSGEHEALFLHLQEYAPFKEQLKSVIEGVYRTLDTVPEHDMALMDIWLIALQNSELAADDSLVFSIQQWEKARQLYDTKNYAGAVAALRKVQVQDHSPIHLDLAYALIAQQNYTDTLTELDKIIGITERTMPTPTPALNVTSSATITPRLATKETVQPIVILPTGFITSTVDANVPNTSLNRNKYYTESDYQRRFDDKDKILSLIRQLIEGNKDLSNYLSAHTNGYPQLSIELGYVVSPIAANPTVAKDIAVDANQEAISYPLKTNALDIWIASVQNYFNQTGQISDNLAAMERRDIPNGVTCDVASVDGGWSLMRNEEWQLLCTMDGFRTTRSLRLNGTAARGLTGGSYYATDNPFTVYGNGLWPEGAYDGNQEVISYPLKTNAIDIWIANIQNRFNKTGQIGDNIELMDRRDIPNGVTCDLASVNGGWDFKQYEEWQLLCSMDDFRTTRSLRLNGTAARGLTGGGYYATDNPFTVYGDGLWPNVAYDISKPTLSIVPITPTPAISPQVAISITAQGLTSYPLKTNAIDIWITDLQDHFSGIGQISDNTELMDRQDIPSGVVCDVGSVDGGWDFKQYEEWQLLCSMDDFRTTRSLRLNGTAARGLTDGGYYATDNPFTVTGKGIWPDEAYDLTLPRLPTPDSAVSKAPDTDVTKFTRPEFLSIKLKLNAIDIWLASIQNRFNKTGQIIDNTEAMERRDIPSGVTCHVASVDGGWSLMRNEEWQVFCSMDGFRTTRSLRLNGTATRGLTGGGYYSPDNPFTVYGDGLWPDSAYDLPFSASAIAPSPTIFEKVTKDAVSQEVTSFPVKTNAIDIWIASLQNRFNKTGRISDNTTMMTRHEIPTQVTCDVGSVAGSWLSKQYEEWQVFCSMDGFRTTRGLRLNGTAIRGLTGGAYYTIDNPFTVTGEGHWSEQAYDSTKMPPAPSDKWTGSYYNNKLLEGSPVYVHQDVSVDFFWGSDSPESSIDADQFSAVWERSIYVPSGTYRFYAMSDDGVRVYIDGYRIIDAWREQPAQSYYADTYLLEGQHWIRIEYYEETGVATIHFWWNKLGENY